MRIYMQTAPGEERTPRFYHLFLQQDLIRGWTLVKENGQQGSPGKVTKQHFETWDEALEAMMTARDRQLNRGFNVVFVQGQEHP
jgi:hypothetical protein